MPGALSGTADPSSGAHFKQLPPFPFQPQVHGFWSVAQCSTARAEGICSFLGMCRNFPPLGDFLLIGSYCLFSIFFARQGWGAAITLVSTEHPSSQCPRPQCEPAEANRTLVSVELRALWWGRSGPGALLPEQNWAFRALLMDPKDWVRLWKLGNQEPNQGVN